jgi:lysozyme
MKLILNYDEFINENYLINEEYFDISSKLKGVLKKIRNFSQNKKRSILIYTLTGLLMVSGVNSVRNVINSDESIKSELVESGLDKVVDSFLTNSKFKRVPDMRLSQSGWDMIKWDEGHTKLKGEPVLTAYKLGDGMITIGWGHAKPVGKSKYKVGDKITREQAQKLLSEDLKVAADGVRRIFIQWEEQGINRKLTQEQFDVLVSMAFNMGVSGLRTSETIQHIKRGDYEKAAESIKTEAISDEFPGLEERRKKESKMFISYLDSVDLSS